MEIARSLVVHTIDKMLVNGTCLTVGTLNFALSEKVCSDRFKAGYR